MHSYTSVHNFCIVMQYFFLQCFYCVLSASFYCNLYHLPVVLFLRFPILWPGWVFHIPIFHSWYNHNHFSRLLSLFFYICALCTVHVFLYDWRSLNRVCLHFDLFSYFNIYWVSSSIFSSLSACSRFTNMSQSNVKAFVRNLLKKRMASQNEIERFIHKEANDWAQ